LAEWRPRRDRDPVAIERDAVMSRLIDLFGSGTVVWLMVLFLGVAYWAFRPRRPRVPKSRTAQEDEK